MAPKAKTSVNLIRALYNLSREPNTEKRKKLLNAGLIEMIKWFSLAARKITEGKMKLPKQTQRFMDKHKEDVRKLANPILDPNVKRSIILKPGGGGFLGGVIIRSLIRWDGNKLMRKSRRRRSLPKKTKSKLQKKKINDKFVTKRKRKKKSHRRGGPSISWQTLGMTSPMHNAELAAAAARTPSPITSTYLSSPNSSLMGMTPRRSITPQSSPSPRLIQIKKFSPLRRHVEHPLLQTARQFGFEAAMRQKYGVPDNQPFTLPTRGPNLKFTKRKLNL